MNVAVPDSLAERLAKRGSAEGFPSAEAYALHVLSDAAADAAPGGLPPRNPDVDWTTPVRELTVEQRLARFDDMMSRVRPHNPDLDDSRDSIYD